jgi:hypothetical protein
MRMNGEQHGLPSQTTIAITSMHWYRQAAMQSDAKAQMCLANAMILSRVEICDRLSDLPGHSAVTEPSFWFGLYEEIRRDRACGPPCTDKDTKSAATISLRVLRYTIDDRYHRNSAAHQV